MNRNPRQRRMQITLFLSIYLRFRGSSEGNGRSRSGSSAEQSIDCHGIGNDATATAAAHDCTATARAAAISCPHHLQQFRLKIEYSKFLGTLLHVGRSDKIIQYLTTESTAHQFRGEHLHRAYSQMDTKLTRTILPFSKRIATTI